MKILSTSKIRVRYITPTQHSMLRELQRELVLLQRECANLSEEEYMQNGPAYGTQICNVFLRVMQLCRGIEHPVFKKRLMRAWYYKLNDTSVYITDGGSDCDYLLCDLCKEILIGTPRLSALVREMLEWPIECEA